MPARPSNAAHSGQNTRRKPASGSKAKDHRKEEEGSSEDSEDETDEEDNRSSQMANMRQGAARPRDAPSGSSGYSIALGPGTTSPTTITNNFYGNTNYYHGIITRFVYPNILEGYPKERQAVLHMASLLECGRYPPEPPRTTPGQSNDFTIFEADLVRPGKPPTRVSGKFDTGAAGNFVSMECITKAGLQGRMQPCGPEREEFVGVEHQHVVPKYRITLSWSYGKRRTTYNTEFYVLDKAPYDILLGAPFILQNDVFRPTEYAGVKPVLPLLPLRRLLGNGQSPQTLHA